LLFADLPDFPEWAALTVFSDLAALVACAALAVCVALAGFAGLAVPRLADALDVAGAAEVTAGVTTGAPAEPLSDAVLRRAGRADPEDVTMGFLREARV
jgi:hypothetical protein